MSDVLTCLCTQSAMQRPSSFGLQKPGLKFGHIETLHWRVFVGDRYGAFSLGFTVKLLLLSEVHALNR